MTDISQAWKPHVKAKIPASHKHSLSCTLFFIISALLYAIFAKLTLLPILQKIYLPLVPDIFTVIGTAALTAYLFSGLISQKKPWFIIIGVGFLMAIFALIMTSIRYYFIAMYYHAAVFHMAHAGLDYVVIFGTVLAMQLAILGSWLIPVTGLLALFYNKRFLPKLIALEWQQEARVRLPK